MTKTLHHPLYADAQNYTDAADDPRLTKPQLICLDGQPVFVDDYCPHWGLVQVDAVGQVSIVQGLGCVEPVDEYLLSCIRVIPVSVAREKELGISDLLSLDRGLVYIDDPAQEHGGGYAVVDAAPDAVCLYLADARPEECSYCFDDSDNWARDENIHIFACKEANHD